MEYDVKKILKEKGLDPIEGLLSLAFSEEIEPSVRRQALKDILDRVSPTLKAVEHVGDKKLDSDLQELKDKMDKLEALYKKDY